MRRIHLLYDQRSGGFVQSLKTSSAFTLPALPQDDTVELAIAKVAESTDADGTLDPYVIKPWGFSEIRVSIGEIDRTPQTAKFKLRVDDADTEEIAWPTDLTAPGIESWKNSVLAKLNQVAGNGAAVRTDPPNCPVNYLYFTWTDPEDDREIEIVEVRAVPAIDIEHAVRVTQINPAFEQVVRLVRLPIAMATVFDFEMPPAVEVTIDRPGGPGANAEQIITIPKGAAGAFDLGWNSGRTKSLAVATVTAAEIQDALNAIVPNGTSNPSFRVEARGTGRFVVQFIGPLAGAPQIALDPEPRDQEPTYFAVGKLSLKRGQFERALNGLSQVTLNLELVITDDGDEETIIKPIVILNDMTGAQTAQSAAEQGAILEIERTVVVNNSTLLPITTVAAGFAFVPAEAAQEFSVEHELDTRWLNVVGFRKSGSDWRLMTQNAEFTAESTTADAVEIEISSPVSDDEEDENYFGNFKFYIIKPDATVKLLQHLHSWDEVFDQVLAGEGTGQTVRQKFAAMEAALGIIAGKLNIDVSNLVGKLTAGQIDIKSFLEAITALVATDAEARSLWEQTVLAATTTETAIKQFIDIAKANPDWIEAQREILLDLLTSNPDLVPGVAIQAIPDFTLTVPRPYTEQGSPVRTLVPATEEKETTNDGTTVRQTYTTLVEDEQPTQLVFYPPLSLAFGALTDGGNKENVELEPDDTAIGKVFTVVGNAVAAAAVEGRDRVEFKAGAKITYANNHWYEVKLIGGTYYPAETEARILVALLSAAQLGVGSGWNLTYAPQFVVNSDPGASIAARGELVIEYCMFDPANGAPRLDSLPGITILTVPIIIGPAPLRLRGGVTIKRTAAATFTGTVSLGAFSTTFAPTSPNCAIRLTLTKVDPEGDAPLASLVVTSRGATASIIDL